MQIKMKEYLETEKCRKMNGVSFVKYKLMYIYIYIYSDIILGIWRRDGVYE